VQNKKKKKREEPTSKNDCRPEYHRPRSNMAAQPLAHYDPGWPKIRQSVRSTETFHDNTFLAFYGPFNHLNLATDLRGTSSFQLPSVTLFASSSLHPANSILSHTKPAPASQHQPALLFSYKKSAPATSTSQSASRTQSVETIFASIISTHEQVAPTYVCILSFGPRSSIGGRCLL